MTCNLEAVAKKLMSVEAKPSPDELNEAVSTGLRRLLERYHQTHGVAIAKITGEREGRPFDNSWQDKALSHFKESAWEGELLLVENLPLAQPNCRLMLSFCIIIGRCCQHLQKDPRRSRPIRD
jgi:hypothetical protein